MHILYDKYGNVRYKNLASAEAKDIKTDIRGKNLAHLTLNIDSIKVVFDEYFVFYDDKDDSRIIRYPVSHFFETWENISKCNTFTNVGKMSVKVKNN